MIVCLLNLVEGEWDAIPLSAWFVGKVGEREASGLVVDMIRGKKTAGRVLLLVGLPSIRKSALGITQELSSKWFEKQRFDLARLLCSILRAFLHAYDPLFSMTLRYLISIHKVYCFRQGIFSPISDLTERLLFDDRDPPATPQESLYEVDIQALAHAVELTRQGAVDSLKFAKGDLFQAFQVGLESLNLGICPKLSVLQIEAPKMSVLELKGCGVLAQTSISCPSLKSLDASFCRELLVDSLAMASASFPLIESLILSCLSIGVDGLSSLHSLRCLTLLDLSYTHLTNLQPVFGTCSQLVILKLSACKLLTDSSLDALYKEGALPALRELDLSYSSIGQSAILGLLACCTNLVNVNLNGCANMHDLVWDSSDCHSPHMIVDIYPSNSVSMKNKNEVSMKTEHLLEILNCIGCPNIKKVSITSSACSHLSKLNLNLSANLKEVDLACFNLNSLNLSNCYSLEFLTLDCPRLTNLQLLACTMLPEEAVKVAISRCNMLENLNILSCPKIQTEFLDELRGACPSLKRIQGSLSA